jgi:cytochrome c
MTKPLTCIATAAALLLSGPAFAVMDDAAATAALGKAGCRACHAVDKKMVGPSYQDIAKKYKGDPKAVAMLSEKVRKGGTGNWGQIPMPPSPPEKISDADLKAVLEWILAK